MTGRARRREWIARLIARGGVASQEKLRDLLAERSVRITQATLSRDLRDLGAVKGPGGYALVNGNGTTSAPAGKPAAHRTPPGKFGARRGGPAAQSPGGRALDEALLAYLLRASRGGTIVVLGTGPGQAQALALALDRAELPGALGTVAGDDTIFMAARSERAARDLLESLRARAGLGGRP